MLMPGVAVPGCIDGFDLGLHLDMAEIEFDLDFEFLSFPERRVRPSRRRARALGARTRDLPGWIGTGGRDRSRFHRPSGQSDQFDLRGDLGVTANQLYLRPEVFSMLTKSSAELAEVSRIQAWTARTPSDVPSWLSSSSP